MSLNGTRPSRSSSTSSWSSSTSHNELDEIDLPRILCLHGGGTNAEVMRMQSRAFVSGLREDFHLVFADAPFLTDAHPAIVPVYEDFGPFRMWYRWRRNQRRCGGPKAPDSKAQTNGTAGDGGETNGAATKETSPRIQAAKKEEAQVDEFGDEIRDDDEAVLAEVEYQMQSAMAESDRAGFTGEWVGLLGFSQGARVSGSILFDRQLHLEKAAQDRGVDLSSRRIRAELETQTPGFAGGNWKFGVLIAGRGPFIEMSELGAESDLTQPAGDMMDFSGDMMASNPKMPGEDEAQKLKAPTLHIHGLKDPAQKGMRQWYESQFAKGKCGTGKGAELIEWGGNHRLPFKSSDMGPMLDAIIRMGAKALES